jgi:hypothetical protein
VLLFVRQDYLVKKTRASVTQKSRKIGRPKALIESEQVQVRLPVIMVAELRKAGTQQSRSLSEEIRDRLGGSLLPPRTDAQSALLGRQVEQIAKEVGEAYGAPWHQDRKAHAAFVETLKLLIADLQAPAAEISKVTAAPAQAAELIYNRHLAVKREWEKSGEVEVRAHTPLKNLLGDGQ